MVQSVLDPYCVINRAKVYERRYDRHLRLAPWMTVEHLIDGDNLPALIEQWIERNALNLKAGEMITRLRSMFDAGLYPLSAEQHMKYERQRRNPRVGDLGVVLLGSALQDGEEESFGSFMRIYKPNEFLHGNGTPAPTGGTVNLYQMGKGVVFTQLISKAYLGALAHPFEFFVAAEATQFSVLALAAFIDEFRMQVLRRNNPVKTINSRFICANCKKSPTKERPSLKNCGRCNLVQYCSIERQKAHWKSTHKSQCDRVMQHVEAQRAELREKFQEMSRSWNISSSLIRAAY